MSSCSLSGVHLDFVSVADISPTERFTDFVRSLALTINTLKNRQWRQTNLKTDQKEYFKRLYETIPKFFSFVQSLKFDLLTWFEYYYRKNKVNLWRIKTKY